MFLARFLISNIFSIILIGFILLLKTLLKDKVSPKFHYRIWFSLMLSLLIVFLPTSFFQSAGFESVTESITTPTSSVADNTLIAPDMPSDWRYDFNEIVDTSEKVGINALLVIVWAVGVFAVIIFYMLGNRRLKRIKRCAECPSDEIRLLFEDCCQSVTIKHKVALLASDIITSPLNFGYGTSYIVIPKELIGKLKTTELQHIFLHELTHIKHKDIWLNLGLCVEQIIYWFNPVVWFAFSKMRRDREAYCDWSVINCYDTDEERLRYGDTLLQFATLNSDNMLYSTNGLFENYNQLKYRIEKIANFKKETVRTKIVGCCLSITLIILVIIQTPVFAAFASDFGLKYTPPKSINIVQQNYNDIFGDNDGCAVIFDMKSNTYQVYNQEAITTRIAPCSTYKIYSAINALEQGIITPESNTIEWDYLHRQIPSWDGNQNLNSALRYSVNWYFQFLDKTVGAEELEKFYTRIEYGNCCIGNDTAYYWNGSSLKISPLEQVELLKKLYTNEFGFKEANVNAVKNAIMLSDNNSVKVYGKTGTGKIGNADVNGWFIGYIETADNTYVFAINIKNEKNANGQKAIEITTSIFERMGIKIDL